MSGTDSQNWKEKYLQAVEDFDKRAKQAQNRMDILRKGLVRVSLAADGQDSELDEELAQLRNALRNDIDVVELDPLVTRLEEMVVALDDRRKDAHTEVRGLIEGLLDEYLGLDLPRDSKSAIKKYRKELPALLEGNGLNLGMWHDYAGIQRALLAYVDELKSSGEEDNGGFFQKLFSGGSKRSKGTKNLHNDREDASRFSSTNDLDTNEGEDDREAIKERIASVLRSLLEQIDLPENLQQRKEALLHRIETEFHWEELPEFLTETADLVASTRMVAQQEFEGFLLTLHARLQDIQEFLQTARQGEEQSQLNQAKLDEEVRTELREMRTSVETASDVNQIKLDIESMVGRIISVVDEFHTLEKDRRDEVYDRIEQLGRRMEAMESEATVLKDSLEATRIQALKDALTELPNRQAYDEQIEREYSRWKRHGHPLAIAIVDIDHFKMINDKLGHLRGDKVLKLVAREVSRRVRGEDFVARYGGEEFVIIMPDTDEQSALAAIEKVRMAVEECPFNFNNERVPVTASFGVSGFVEGDTIESCFERADKGLYKAKDSGRNKVCRMD